MTPAKTADEQKGHGHGQLAAAREPADPETGLGLSILSHILIGTPASPLRKALIDSGLGEDLTGGGLETSCARCSSRSA